MKYDFTSILERAGKDAIAVDIIPFANAEVKGGFDKIPMWVADMNFPVLPTIQDKIIERVGHPAFGYYEYTDEYYNSIINWQQKRNGVSGIAKENIGYQNGVVGGVVSAVMAFTAPGDSILLHAPAYIGFIHAIEDSGRKIVFSDLKRDENGTWRMDYEDMAHKIKENKIHLAIFCSPHNPTGRVWTREELQKAMEIYKENDCIVVSDEIWADLTLEDYKHIPTQSVSEDAKNRTIALYAPSKTFNLAGLIGSYHIVYNPYLKDRYEKQAALCNYNHMNVLSMHALIGAYSEEGSIWVDELRNVLTGNVEYAYNFICEHFEGVSLAKPEGTYMLYLDCSEWCKKHGKTVDELIRAGIEVGVIWQDGRPFGKDNTIRMNLALPFTRVREAFERLEKYVF